MTKFNPKVIGDVIQLTASAAVVIGLIALIVAIARLPGGERLEYGHPPRSVVQRPVASVTEARQSELETFVHLNCSPCHGSEGRLGPLLSRANLQHLSESSISLTILHGRTEKGMPAWDAQLSPADADWIAEYLKRGGFTDEHRAQGR